ncbi:right-handed parallel beta-helix repeat-containing protein, partial [Gimesia fumaroli]|uniref:NosD domain-containing protein n=1 Tax=Gimesia fumaroli TaxID=2527976 RepID=UPI0018D89632
MLLTNWLGTITSRIKKRPTFRSRDRRAIRRRWHAAVNNQISTTEVLEDRTLLTTFFVDDSLELTNDQGAAGLDAGDTVTFAFGEAGQTVGLIFGTDAFATIQDAVDAAQLSVDPTDTINVAAGTYTEDVIVDTSVILRGANAGIAGNGVRGAESLIDPSSPFGIEVRADDVTIDGFEITGLNRDGINVRPTNSGPGVSTRENIVIQNNYIHETLVPGSQVNGIVFGEQVVGGPDSTDMATISFVTISDNLIDVTDDNSARGVVMTGHFASIHFDNFDITGNVIQAKNNGLFFSENPAIYTAAGIEILDNTFESPGSTGINAGNLDSTSKVNGNTFINNATGAALNFAEAGGEVLNNIFENNTNVGLYFFDDTYFPQSSENPTVTGNTFTNNARQVGGDAPAVDFDAIQNNNSYDGGVEVSSNGNLYGSIQEAIDNAMPGDDVTVVINATYTENVDINKAVTLMGEATVDGSVTASVAGATIAPGFSPGTFTSTDLNLTAGSSLSVEIDGISGAGVVGGHDQFVTTGNVNLGGATLDTTGSDIIGAMLGDTFEIIDVGGTLTGTFAGLDNGDTVLVNGQTFRIFYNGGDGNDVILTFLPPVPVTYVDTTFTGVYGTFITDADPNQGGDQNAVIGVNAFASIQEAVTAASAGATIDIAAGTYAEDVIVNTSVILQGANAGIAAGVDPGVRGTESELTGGFRLFANDVVIDGLKIIDGTGPAGIGSQSAVFMTAGTTGHTIENNILEGPGTGVESRGVLSTFNGNNDNITIQNNEIYAWVAGIHNQGNTNVDILGNNFHDVVVGIANDFVADVSIEGNAFSNASGGVGVFNNTSNGIPDVAAHNNFFDSSTLTELIGHHGGDAVDASGNWWGSTDETTIANSMKSGGVAGDASQVDFTSFLNNGADTNVGLAGFQGDFSTLNVTSLGAQTGPGGRIQEAIDSVTAGGTVNILAGTYSGNVDATGNNVILAPGNSPGQVTINGNLTLNGDDTLDIEMNSAIAGTGFDQLVVNGTVSLGGVTLNLIDGFDPAEGDEFVIIDNVDVHAVAGTFNGLAEGHEFTDFLGVIGQSAFLTYAGGDGNDVAIVVENSTPVVDLPVDGNPDDYTIELVGGNVVITDDATGDVISNTPLAALGGPIVINGEDGQDDTLTFDLTGIDENTGLEIVFNGGVGGNDELTLIRTGALTSLDHIFQTPSDGLIFINGQVSPIITYTGLEPITDNVVVANRTFTFIGATETITLSDDGDVGDGQSFIDSNLSESVVFVHPTNSLTIRTEALGGSGADIINIDGIDSTFDQDLIVLAGTDDTINTAAVDIGSGLLDLTADQVNVNGAFTTTGSVDIESTAQDITFGAAGSIDAGASDIDLTAFFNVESVNVTTTSEVRVTATGGGINDLNGNALITADRVALRAGGAGGGITGLETDVNTLAVSATGGGFAIDNTGDLVIGTVDGLSGITANSSTIFFTTTGALTVNEAVSAGIIAWLSATDSGTAGQDINVNADITSTSGDISLEAGDNFNLATGVTLDAATALSIEIDSFNADAGGSIANLNGDLIAGTQITVFGQSDDDQVIIDGNAGATNDGGTVDGIQSLFSFVGGGGTDELIVDDSGDVTGDTILVQSLFPGSGAVIGATGVTLGFETLENLTLFAGTDADDITVSPNALTSIDIFGGDPAIAPGDTLTYLTPPGETSTFTPAGLDGGTIGATGGFQDVVFDEIEGLTFGGSVAVDGTAGDDVLTITATSADSGTYQINGGPVINFNAATDFTFNGLAGDDRLVINNPGGGVFDPLNGIFFNGGSGGETLGDTLEILGGTAGSVEHRFTTENDGSVFYNGEGVATITYTGLEPVLDTIVATDRIFSFLGAGETITLSDNAGAGDGISLIDSTLGESVAFVHPAGTVTINTETSGGSGVDQVNINAVDSTFTANLTVNAGTDDIITTTTVDIGAGVLDLTAGLVNVNGAFTTTGSVDIEATASDIEFNAVGSIDAGASDIDLTAFFNIESLQVSTTSEVRVTASGGGINDLTGNALITADRAALRVGGPGGITGIDTNVNTLATSVTSGGFSIDNTGALEIGTVDGLAGITAAASSIFLTTTGTLTVNEAVTGRAVDLRSNDTMTISNNVAASMGTLKLQNFGGDFVLNSPAQVSNAAAFLIDIDSAGTVDLAEGSIITSLGTGLIDIDAVNNINLASITTGGEVQVTTSAGSITDNTAAETALIDASTVALRAATGIGAAGPADIDLDISFMAANATSGNIFLQDPSLTTVGTVDGLAGITAGGNIDLDMGGLNLNEQIEATGAASTIVVNSSSSILANDTVRTNGGTIDLLANNDLSLFSFSLVDTTSAAVVTLTADNDSVGGGSFEQSNASLVNARGGDLDVSGSGDLRLVDLQSAGGTVTVTTNGTIFDNSVSEAALVTAGEVALRAAFGIGAAGASDIDLAVGRVAASSPLGNIVLSNTGALEIGTVDGLIGVDAGAGQVIASAASPLTVASNVTAAGTVTLTSTDAAGPGDDLTINAGVTVESTGADVVLNSGDNFLLALTGEVIADTTITINVDPITDGAGATVDLLGNVDATLTTINGGDDADTFNILPTQDSPITINGGNPTLPTVPGDVLNLDFTGLTSPVLTLGMSPGSGTFSFAGDPQLPVTYSSIENVNTSTGAYHLVLDMLASGFQNAAADTIDAMLDGTGTDLVIDINAANFFTGAQSDILSFTVIGSADSDTLNINESPGGLPFFTTAAPAIGASNGSHLNAAADFFLEDIFNPNTYDATDITIHFDGGAGVDDVNVGFITDHDAGYFSDMDDTLGSGNIVAALTGDTDIDLGLSFARVEGAGIFGTTTGGGLHVDASATPATTQVVIDDALGAGDGISQVMANGGFTNLLFGGFNDLQLVSGPGSETIDLIALDSITSLINIELDADDVFGTNAADNDVIRVHSAPLGVLNINILAAAGDDVINVF